MHKTATQQQVTEQRELSAVSAVIRDRTREAKLAFGETTNGAKTKNQVARSPVDTGMISWVTTRLPRKPHQTQSKNKSENRTGIEIEIGIGVSRNARTVQAPSRVVSAGIKRSGW